MLKQLILENWKSFRYAELPLDPLTVVIGTNASGKSNVVEALEFLQRIARGENIEAALAGDKRLNSIRGGIEWAALQNETQFTLKVLVNGEEENIDYLYVIKIQTLPVIKVIEEYIECKKINGSENNNVKRYTIKNSDFNSISSLRYLYSDIKDIRPENLIPDMVHADRNAFKTNPNLLEEILDKKDNYQDIANEYLILKNKAKKYIIASLENTLVLNPIPSKMRDYSRLSDVIENDASNIAGVLATLPHDHKVEVESTLSTYLKDLPEGDIQKVWAEKVGRFGTDAMLYCQEQWKPGHITEIDARSMSDGTLRFLAILTALLTRPEGSQLVIEEIDNGLHPSRAELLVRILREIGSKRKIDILLTTHNPALLDALGPEIVPFVVVAHRDKETGESKLTLLEDIENLPLLLASGTLGKLATKGAIEKSLSDNK